MAAIKSMAALFTAFDRPNYQKLIPQHVVDMLTIPEDLLSKLSHGGLTVSIRGRPGHSVGIDEAHEMCVNKDCKEYITRPSADYINRTAAFLPVRAKAIKNLETQLFPEHKHVSVIKPITTIHTKEVSSTKLEMNVRSQMLQLEKATSLTLTLSGRENLLKISRVDGGWVWPVQSQEWEVKFFVPQATNSIWRRETRTMATPMRSLSVGVAKSVRELFLDRCGRGFDDCVHRRRSIAKSVQKRSRLK